MEKEKSIYKLELHETMATQDFFIIKVPGGWIYTMFANNQSVFVPYSGN